MISLSVTKRDPKTSMASLKWDGRIAGVFYGKKEKSTPISISLVDFQKALDEAGESTVLSLTGDGVAVEALIHDVQYNPITDVPQHVDFYVVEKGQKVQVGIPLEFEGVSPAVKDLGATLVKVLHEVEVEAEPRNLPQKFVIDISALTTMDSQILVKDIKLPAGVELVTKEDDVIASVSEAMKEEETPVVMDISQIEVEKKGKVEEEGAEGADAGGDDKK
ncbi:MAG TPA: 50S ribosomal protein L25 [Candidatus Paceibacterota bacterium]|nr:50S ribosomal protein L25 [Candidatus Paceibacterota bacterium]